MLKILKEKWAKNSDKLFKRLSEINDDNHYGFDYADLVKLTFDIIYNEGEDPYSCDVLNTGKIFEIDDGDYQGTILFLIPFDSYQPDESEYLMTYIGYGSCTVCDALQSAFCNDDEQRTKALFTIAKDIITNTIKPYNYGWRHNDGFDQATFEEEDNA